MNSFSWQPNPGRGSPRNYSPSRAPPTGLLPLDTEPHRRHRLLPGKQIAEWARVPKQHDRALEFVPNGQKT